MTTVLCLHVISSKKHVQSVLWLSLFTWTFTDVMAHSMQ